MRKILTRKPQGRKDRGSQKWLQVLVNEHPQVVNSKLVEPLRLTSADEIAWKSPVDSDDYAEYLDQAAFNLMGASLSKRALGSFWPAGGPNWDGLAVAGHARNRFILVEAKSHMRELCSTCGAKNESLRLITKSIVDTKSFVGAGEGFNWLAGCYQYANRLAHLYLLRELNGLDAYLVFIYFVNDEEMGGPRSEGEWRTVIELAERSLGVCGHRLSKFAPKIFIDVNELRQVRHSQGGALG